MSKRSVHASPFQALCETSQGKARDFRSTCPPHLRPPRPDGHRASGLFAPLPTRRTPPMRFVFLGPELCLQLPPRSPSRSHACCSTRGSRPSGPAGDSHPQVTSRSAFASRLLPAHAGTRHAWRIKKRGPRASRRVALLLSSVQYDATVDRGRVSCSGRLPRSRSAESRSARAAPGHRLRACRR